MKVMRARILRAACFALAAGIGVVASAQNAVVPEYSLKAAYLYHFIQFTDWPDLFMASRHNIEICIAPDSPLRPILSGMNGKIAHDKPILVRTYELGKYEQCQVVVFSARDKAILERGSSNLMLTNILTVSESPAITADGAIITFIVEDTRVLFSINRTLAQSSGLTISSKLLRLARSVK